MKTKNLTRVALLAGIVLGMTAIAMSRVLSAREGAQTKAFTFVQICDTQLGMGGYEHDVKSFGQAVKQINALRPDFVVVCGDLVHTPNDKSFADFNKIKLGFAIPCYCAAGNHDVGNPPTLSNLKRYRDVIGRDYYSFEHKGYTFVIVNTQLWKTPLEQEAEKHDSWFRETLKAAHGKGSPVFVIGHYPLFVKNPDEKSNYYNLPPEKRKELLNLYKQYGVVAMLAGHTHKTIINDYQGIHLVNGETTSKNFDKRPLGFRLWHVVSSKSIKHEFIPLEEGVAEPSAPADADKPRR